MLHGIIDLLGLSIKHWLFFDFKHRPYKIAKMNSSLYLPRCTVCYKYNTYSSIQVRGMRGTEYTD